MESQISPSRLLYDCNYLLYSSGEPANFIPSQGKFFLLAV